MRDWSSTGLAWLRILVGSSIVSHGFDKMFGGGMPGFIHGVTTMGFPMPHFFAWAAVLSEFLGGLFLILGFGTRIAAFFIFCTMSVALFIRHGADPFRAKELAYLYWSVSGALMLMGGGKFTAWRLLTRRM